MSSQLRTIALKEEGVLVGLLGEPPQGIRRWIRETRRTQHMTARSEKFYHT